MSKRGENIYKRKDGRWEGRYVKDHINGKIKYGYVFAKTYNEVKSKLVSARISKNDMSAHFVKNSNIESDRFDVLAEEWFNSKKPQWKQSSIVKYTNILNLYLLPSFSNRIITLIKRDEVLTFSSCLMIDGGANGEGLSPKTVTSIISVMKNIFEYAEQVKGYLVANIKGITIKQTQKPMRILSYAEQLKLSQYLCQNITPCNLGILLCLYTGLRVGEICALKWEDISFEEQYLYVHKTMQRLQTNDSTNKTAINISTPKSDCSIRKVPIPNDIFYILKNNRQQDNSYILTGSSAEFIEPRTMQNRFKAVLKNCNIDDANFHALRHTFATRCVELGFDIKSLSEILGHASVNITLNRYVHPSMELKQQNMNKLSELLAVR